MADQMHGVYVGPRQDLVGEKALLIQVDEETVKAQFDNLYLSKELNHGWTEFPADDFDIDPPVNWEE